MLYSKFYFVPTDRVAALPNATLDIICSSVATTLRTSDVVGQWPSPVCTVVCHVTFCQVPYILSALFMHSDYTLSYMSEFTTVQCHVLSLTYSSGTVRVWTVQRVELLETV